MWSSRERQKTEDVKKCRAVQNQPHMGLNQIRMEDENRTTSSYFLQVRNLLRLTVPIRKHTNQSILALLICQVLT